MGRANASILAIGILACLAMVVMMQHAVGVADHRRPSSAVAAEIDRVLGTAAVGSCNYEEVDIGGRPIAFVRLRLATDSTPRDVAATVGDLVWKRRSALFAVVVDCTRADDSVRRFQVPPPGSRNAVPVPLDPPRRSGAPAKSRSAASPPSAPAGPR